MSDRVSVCRLAAGALVPAPLVAMTLLIGSIGVAQADMRETWVKETFKSERAAVVASLSSDDEDDEDARPARRAPRASIVRSMSGKTTEHRRQAKTKRTKPVRVASLGASYAPAERQQKSIAHSGNVRWRASASCLNGTLRGVLAQIASRFGSVTVNSTCRSRRHNARVGGAHRSKHLTGDAVDFRINGSWRGASSYIRGMVGGFKHYGGGLFHIDTGARRTW